MAKSALPKRLPKAPLAEVVFEFRWALQGSPVGAPAIQLPNGGPFFAPAQSDPGLLPMLDGFTSKMKRAGFGAIKDMAPPLNVGPHGIARRFYKKVDTPFPIMQVGPGIFATNESANYDFKTFKDQIKQGLTALLAVYPKLKFFPMSPISLELRYIDIFDKSLLGNAALLYFVNNGLTMNFVLPPILNDKKIFSGEAEGRFLMRRPLAGRKNSIFTLDIGSGTKDNLQDPKNNDQIVRLETKVVSTEVGVPKMTSPAKFLKEVETWLEFAHDITSPFFRQLVQPKVMDKFK